MDLLIRIIMRLGLLSGKTLDKAIAKMTALDSYLEEVERIEQDKITVADKAISEAVDAKAVANTNVERAGRIRKRAAEFIA